MRKAWLVGGVVVLAVAGTAALVVTRMQASKAEEERKKAEAANVTLEFSGAEVVAPQRVSLPHGSSSPGRWWRRARRSCGPRPPARCCR